MERHVVTASFAVVLPDEPIPVRLMNTIWADPDGVHDALTTSGDLRAWLTATYPDDQIRGADLARFRTLRDALRRLAAVRTGDNRSAATSAMTDTKRAVAAVNEAASLAPSWPQLVLRAGELRQRVAGPAQAGDRRLTAIAHEAIALFTDPDRAEIRACYAPGCVLYFVQDHPRRAWCSSACGNRARVARHYERHHHPKPAASER